MENNRKRRIILGHLRDLLIIVVLGNFVTLLFGGSMEYITSLRATAYSLLIGGFLWKGNEIVGYLIHKKFDIFKYPSKARIWIRWNLLSIFTYSVIIIILVNYFWVAVLYGHSFRSLFTNGTLITMIIEFGITIAIASIMSAISFFKAWRETAVNEERFKKESIAHQYKALKNQVNPHFLFNSLNTLSTLIYNDQKLAVKFTKQLSEVYRYVLEHKDSELVEVKTEIEFVEKYLYLQRIRHGENLQTEIELKNCNDRMIVPLSLQMLVENSIKHNVVSEDDPLKIKVYNTEDYIIVENNIQKKSSIADSGGIGLNNIKARYEHLTDVSLTIEESYDIFKVKVPLIKYNKT